MTPPEHAVEIHRRAEEQAVQAGVERKSNEFKNTGGKVYQPA